MPPRSRKKKEEEERVVLAGLEERIERLHDMYREKFRALREDTQRNLDRAGAAEESNKKQRTPLREYARSHECHRD